MKMKRKPILKKEGKEKVEMKDEEKRNTERW